MRGKAKYVVAVLLIAAGWCTFYACSPQRALARRLKGADRVVVSNNWEGASLSVKGEEVDRIVKAIGASKKQGPVKAAVDLTLEFHRGAQRLGTVVAGYEVFSIDQKPYLDTTGTLKALRARFGEEHPPMPSP